MTTASGAASYISSAAAVNMINGAFAEHGITLGQDTTILLGLAVGFAVHYLSNKYLVSSIQNVLVTNTQTGVENGTGNALIQTIKDFLSTATVPVVTEIKAPTDSEIVVNHVGVAVGPNKFAGV